MSQAIFQEDNKPLFLPATAYVYANQEIKATIDKAPYVNVSLLTKNAHPDSNLALYPDVEEPQWLDYWTFYGDGELLYEGRCHGDLRALDVITGYNGYWVTVAPAEQWRGKYILEYGTGLLKTYFPCLNAVGQFPSVNQYNVTFLQSKTIKGDKIIHPLHCFPGGTISYPVAAAPFYSEIIMKRNIPDMEWFGATTYSHRVGYLTPAFVQIIGGDISANPTFRVIVDGTYYKTCETELGYELTIPTIEQTFEIYYHDYYEDPVTHAETIMYNYRETSSVSGTVTKRFYKPVKSQEDFQIMISLDAMKIKQTQKFNKRIS